MRPPAFWFTAPNRPSWQARLFAPLSAIITRFTARRLQQSGYAAKVPVICVGNINLGGTGKTPTVIALVNRLHGMGTQVHVVSRGYRGRLDGPVRVDAGSHTARDVGDEPLLIAAFCPVWVSKDRAAGVQAAEAAGAQAIILDDGFQNPSVAKDISIVVVDAGVGFGNGRVAPSGPLREPVDAGLARADLLVLIGAASQRQRFIGIWGAHIETQMALGALEPLRTGMDWAGSRVLAFAGIGRPEKFFATLRGLGADIAKAEALDDHQDLSEALMQRLRLEAEALGAQLVTTEKDAVRLPKSFQQSVLALPVRLELEDWSELDALLAV